MHDEQIELLWTTREALPENNDASAAYHYKWPERLLRAQP